MGIESLSMCLVFLVPSVAIWWLSWRLAEPTLRFPWAMYTGFYVGTTAIGATIIGLSDAVVVEQLEWGVDTSVLVDLSTPLYWGLLYAPLVLPALVIILVRGTGPIAPAVDWILRNSNTQLSPITFLLTLGLTTSYCLYRLWAAGHLLSILAWGSMQSDYWAMMEQRNELFATLGSVFFGFVYVTIPMLSQCAMYQIVNRPSNTWRVLFGLSLGICLFLNMSLMQKSPLMLYLAFLGVGLVELKVVRWQALFLVLGGLVGCLTALMSAMQDDWDVSRSISLMIFRMAHAYPYYVNLYPKVIPYSGIDFGQCYLRLGDSPLDNLYVFQYMYPAITWVDGAAAAPAHVRAYSQGGFAFALFTLVGVGLLLKGIGQLRARSVSSIGFALYMQSVVLLYYLTQTSLAETLLSSYGIVYAFVGIAPLWFLAPSAPLSPAMHRQVPPARRPAYAAGGRSPMRV